MSLCGLGYCSDRGTSVLETAKRDGVGDSVYRRLGAELHWILDNCGESSRRGRACIDRLGYLSDLHLIAVDSCDDFMISVTARRKDLGMSCLVYEAPSSTPFAANGRQTCLRLRPRGSRASLAARDDELHRP